MRYDHDHEQPMTLFSYVYSKLPLGMLSCSIHPNKPIVGL